MILSVPDTLSIVNTLQHHDAASELSSLSVDTAESAAPDGRSSRWEAHREQRRRELIRATRKAIHQLGAESSMEEIALHAGTSKSVFYRYFGDKGGLQQAVGQVVINQMKDSIVEAGRHASSPRAGLVNMVTAYLDMAQTSPNVYTFVTAPDQLPPQTQGELISFFDAVTQLVAAPMEQLGLHNQVIQGYWPQAAIGLVRSAGEMWLNSPASAEKPTTEQMAAHISSWLFDGIGHELKSNQE